MSLARSVVVVATLASTPLLAAGSPQHADMHASVSQSVDQHSPFIAKVRAATERFLDVRNAGPDYQPVLGCVSGPEEGAMGVHYLNGALLDDVLEAEHPEALIYEFKDNVARLVAVEYIVVASVWHQTHAPNDVPILEGQLLQFVDAPNRFGLPAFYELHAWAWRNNPRGAFVDWNPRVSCEGH